MFADICPDMAPSTSTYQAMKLCLAHYVPVDRNLLHIALGAVVVGLCLVMSSALQRPLVVALVLALLAGIAMEALDRVDDIAALGRWRWRASLADVGRTILVPLIVLGAARLVVRKT